MKLLLIALLMLTPAIASAASPEETYLAARDAYISKIAAADKSGMNNDDRMKIEDPAIADLLQQLKRIIGPVALQGVAPEPKLGNDTLLEGDQGFGMIDSLVYASPDDKTRIFVSTETLLKTWIVAHRAWWGENDVPQNVPDALKSMSFYTQSMSQDSAVIKYAELPVKKPPAASFAFAMLVDRAQDIGPRTPDELIVTLIQGGRLFLVHTTANVKVTLMPACEALYEAALKRSAELYETPDRTESVTDRAERIRDDGDAQFHRCFAERAPKEAFFAELVKRAQTIADALPAK